LIADLIASIVAVHQGRLEEQAKKGDVGDRRTAFAA